MKDGNPYYHSEKFIKNGNLNYPSDNIMQLGNMNCPGKTILKAIRLVNKNLILVSVILVSFCGCQTENKSKKADGLKDQIEFLVSSYHDEGKFDGTILVADSSDIIFKGAFGLSNHEKESPLSIESQFYLASVSKQFTASTILLLIQDGSIAPDDPIYPYLPELPDIYQGITFRNLLNHTSGIPDYYNFAKLFSGFTNSDVLKELTKVDNLEFEPGTQYKYSNSAYVLLSILVNRISGLSFANYLKENAFQEAKLTHTIVYDQFAEEPERRVTGYGKDGTLTDYQFRTTGGGGIFSNVEDLYKWHKALSSYSLIKEDIMKLAYKPTILKTDSTVYYGFGWFIDPDDPNHVSHDGTLEGFRTLFDRQLDNWNVIIILSNNSCEYLDEIAEKIRELLKSKHK